jgi:desulfoferrodoxin (superoxide reductase-like protein)
VTIWNEIHPMWESHRITSISLYDEYEDLIEEKFMDYDEDPIVEFDFDDLGEYEIRCRCSLHWVWWKKFVG